MAATRTKLTREEPVRTGPLRRPARLMAAELIARPAGDGVKGVVERSVDMAYMVIDEYMERGRVAARLRSERSDGRNGMSTDPRFSAPFGASSDLMAPWVQMMRMWADGLSAFVPGGPTAVNEWMNAFGPGGAAWGLSVPKVEVRVSSKHVTAVTVDLNPGADALGLKAEPVVQGAMPPAKQRVRVNLASSPGLVTVTVDVPDDHPAGSQSFTIQDRDQQQRGSLRVEVMPES